MANHFCASPTGVFLTVHYHYGRERAKTCQYIHLVSCVAMFVKLRLRGESRSGKGGPDFHQCPSAYIMQIKGIPQWCHGSCELEVSAQAADDVPMSQRSPRQMQTIRMPRAHSNDKCDLVRVSRMMLLSRTARWNLRKRGAEQTQYPWHFRPANQLTADQRRKLSRFVTCWYLAAEQFQDQVMV